MSVVMISVMVGVMKWLRIVNVIKGVKVNSIENVFVIFLFWEMFDVDFGCMVKIDGMMVGEGNEIIGIFGVYDFLVEIFVSVFWDELLCFMDCCLDCGDVKGFCNSFVDFMGC